MTDMFYWAQLAYEGYRDQMTKTGNDRPIWDDLPMEERSGWLAGSYAVRKAEIGACGAGIVCKARI